MVKRQEAKQKAKIFTQKYSEVMNEFNNLQSQLTTVQGEIKTNTKSFENYESEDIRINNEIKYEANNLVQIEEKIKSQDL